MSGAYPRPIRSQPKVDAKRATRKRRTKERETPEFLAMVRRMIRASGRRCADADEPELAMLVGLQTELEEAIDVAVIGLRDRGVSWATIGAGLGITKQAAHKRWSEVAA